MSSQGALVTRDGKLFQTPAPATATGDLQNTKLSNKPYRCYSHKNIPPIVGLRPPMCCTIFSRKTQCENRLTEYFSTSATTVTSQRLLSSKCCSICYRLVVILRVAGIPMSFDAPTPQMRSNSPVIKMSTPQSYSIHHRSILHRLHTLHNAADRRQTDTTIGIGCHA